MADAYVFGLNPTPFFVDDVRSHGRPLTNLLAGIDIAVHVYTVGIDVQMENATLGIPVQGNDVLRAF